MKAWKTMTLKSVNGQKVVTLICKDPSFQPGTVTRIYEGPAPTLWEYFMSPFMSHADYCKLQVSGELVKQEIVLYPLGYHSSKMSLRDKMTGEKKYFASIGKQILELRKQGATTVYEY